MRYERRYIQFNDLVFDDMDMIGESDATSASFKMDTTPYSYGHGSYTPFKRPSLHLKETQISMTLYLHMKKLPCEKREFYRDFAVEQLAQPGKLWAVQDNQLVWAYAYVANYSESTAALVNQLQLDVDFVAYEGIWHKADPYTTFLQPYNVCTYLGCFNFKKKQDCNCCISCVDQHEPNIQFEECCCACDSVSKDMALCSHWDDLQSFYEQCSGTGFRIVQDCVAGEQFFADSEFLGQKLCNMCGGLISGLLYSYTSIPTDNFTIVLHGKMHDPIIKINGNANQIMGDYEGALMIGSNGDLTYLDRCCETEISPLKWEIPDGMDYGWTINPRNNSVVIDMGDCCEVACAYFQIDALTY